MKRHLIIAMLTLAASINASAQTVKFVDRGKQERIDVVVDGKLFTSYRWGGDLYRPALYPIMSPGGHFITRGFPFETRDGDTIDHPHQVGCWLAHSSVNGIDFWNSSKFRSAKEMERMGRVVHTRVVSTRASGGVGLLSVDADWVMPDGHVVLHEHTDYKFSAKRAERTIYRTTTLTAANGDVVFGDNKDGFFGLHLASELEQDDQVNVKVTSAAGVISTDRPRQLLTGQYWNSDGLRTEKEIWGKVGRWAAVAGHIGTENITVAIFDHPTNPLPARMMVRGYGLFALNPFGRKQFDTKLDEQNEVLANSKSFVFRYGVYMGSERKPSIEDEYREFTRH